MDQEIRNKLRNFVTQCRRLLEDAITQELEGKYSIFAKKDQVTADPNAEMKNLTSKEDREARKDILDHLEHIKARGFKPKDALDQLIREIAFTHLNRLCAYKMMEAREVFVGGQKFREAVSRGVNSNGVKFYLAEHPEEERLFNTGHQDVAYRHFLDWLGGALSEEIGVLFNPNDPANRLYPRQKTLDEVLELLNEGGIKAEETKLREQWPLTWSQDETIGWVYQYFTPKELRDQARKESQAPRNSYELAFRNQFFTPRYVVEFLTDNTLGRIWYEMRNGETKLKDQCRYMVRRPTEIFLKEGEQPPKDAAEGQDDLSQEELLKLPVHIPHRPKKDPRELKILDPACGSGHFLLYCFDLLLTIYEEAYADPDLGPALKKDYPTLDALKRDVPRLILAHNLHGIDIDLRASQIAALALWLRCQRAYQDMGLKKDRPKITRSNFVCAEPMPGEEQMLKEFVGQLEPKVLGQVVEVVFDKMKLAGEAGSLLKIEEEIRDAVAAAKKQYVRETTQATDRKGRSLLFSEAEMDRISGKPIQPSLFDVSDITDSQFFEQAEARVVEALRSFAEKAQNGHRLQRRLFTDDAVRGFAFVDLCRNRYDVVLMNPPFGAASTQAKASIDRRYPRTKADLYSAFVERGAEWLVSGGSVGAITSRTGFFLYSFERWREELLLDEVVPSAFADLGYGVLDTAMVETSAYCLSKNGVSSSIPFFRLQHSEDKAQSISSAIHTSIDGKLSDDVFVVDPQSFRLIPGSPFAYWLSSRVRNLSRIIPAFEKTGEREVRVGLQTSNNDRFVRCWWEVNPSHILDGQSFRNWRSEVTSFLDWSKQETFAGKRWVYFPKGGSYSPFYSPIHLVVNWEENGREMKEFARHLKSRISSPPGNGPLRDFPYYFRFGLTWSYRTHRLCIQELPAGSIISTRSSGIYLGVDELPIWLALGNSQLVDYLVKISLGRLGHPQFDQGCLKKIPFPSISGDNKSAIRNVAIRCLQLTKVNATMDECSPRFVRPSLLHTRKNTIRDRFEEYAKDQLGRSRELQDLQQELNSLALNAYKLSAADGIPNESGEVVTQGSADGEESEIEDGEGEEESSSNVGATLHEATSELVSYCVGCTFGRWDLQQEGKVVTSEPFEPLPAYSPAMRRIDYRDAVTRESRDPRNIIVSDILLDDVDHIDDTVRRVRDVLDVIFRVDGDRLEKEICEILDVNELRDYFRKSGKGGFWDDHISRYSKSRRKAPIYWLLQSSKKNYAIWLYYHRLDKDLLFKALVNYVEPKVRLETSRLDSLRSQKVAAGDSGKEAKRLAKETEKQEDFLSELRDFEDKLRRAANLHLEPDLNDGVVLNIAPLWELVPWKEAKKYWDELLEGQYEWSSIGKQLRQKGLVK
jgi:hypothetical protein